MPKFIAIATFEADDIDDARNKFCAIGYKRILEGVSGKLIMKDVSDPDDQADFLENDMPDIIRYTMDEWPREVIIKRAEEHKGISLEELEMAKRDAAEQMVVNHLKENIRFK